MMRVVALAALAMFIWAPPIRAQEPSTKPPAGLRENTPATHALIDARLVLAPGKVVPEGAIIVRDGVILEVGAEVETPEDARVWDLEGKTIYPGLLDAYSELPSDAAPKVNGAGYWNPRVTPQLQAASYYEVDESLNEKLRSQGVAARLAAPAAGIVKGTSVLVTTADTDLSRAILKEDVALHGKLSPQGGSREQYPNSPMGAVALFRQALYDSQWYGQAWEAFAQPDAKLPRPERNNALVALAPYTRGEAALVIDAPNELYFLRADRLAREFGLRAIVRGSGKEYRRLDAVKATGRAVIVPLNFPKAPYVKTPEMAMAASLEDLLHWDLAPENAGRLVAAGVRIALTSHGLSDQAKFLKAVRLAVRRGLKPEAALRALTTTPAELFGVAERLGTLAPGKAANLVVTDGDLFDEKTKVLETWIDGTRHEIEQTPWVEPRGTWELTLAGEKEPPTIEVKGTSNKLSGKVKRGEKETALDNLQLDGTQLVATFEGEPVGWEGRVQLSATVSADSGEEAWWIGAVVWADGRRTPLAATRIAPFDPDAKDDDDEKDEDESSDKDSPENALFAVNYPLGAFGVQAPPEQPATVLFRNATVWTCGPQGVLKNAAVLVENGKIKAVAQEIEPPAGALVVDCQGRHITPGLIDCHSHIATDGGINESAQTITAEVRIGDFIDSDDVSLYRQLAGGVTAANILHGSANTIGGQNQVIKFRWGQTPEAMKFQEAPPGIKFALGENVKQSNWGERYSSRYPQTRMGVEQLVRDAFEAAKEYRQRWEAWKKDAQGPAPRVDLELEALAEVLSGERLIHCHSYRQDEILALMRTCEDYGVRIGTLQHILEGYKVADAMAQHGAGGSSFSDWWAYKFEVYDAIPYNGAVMSRAGVVVSFNSDDPELGRRLNTEAAKAVKYGGVDEEEALKFVTLNPAIQLGIDRWVGSLEEGKDADLVVWSGPPLSTFSRAEQAWIDGRKYFDRSEDLKRRETTRRMRSALVQRILSTGAAMAGPGESDDAETLWPRHDIFCTHSSGNDRIR